MLVKSIYIKLGALARSIRDNGPTFMVNIEHQLGGFFETVTKKFLKYESYIRHQIDRVVPDDDNPRLV